MRSLEKAAILVIRATDGLGRMVAGELAAEGATVLLHGRSEGRAEDALRGIREATGNPKPRRHLADLLARAGADAGRTGPLRE